MKYMLLMNSTKAQFDWYAKWPKKDLEATSPSCASSARKSRTQVRSCR